MLFASIRPVFNEGVHVSLKMLEVFLRQVGHMVLQLVYSEQLAVLHNADVLVYTSSQTGHTIDIQYG